MGYPVRLKEQKLQLPLESTLSTNQMAGLHTCRNAREALKAFNNNSGTSISIPPISCIPTLALTEASAQALISALAQAAALALDLPSKHLNENLQKTTKLALELFLQNQKYIQFQVNSAFCKWPLKAWFSDLYYSNLHLDFYCFCQ